MVRVAEADVPGPFAVMAALGEMDSVVLAQLLWMTVVPNQLLELVLLTPQCPRLLLLSS